MKLVDLTNLINDLKLLFSNIDWTVIIAVYGAIIATIALIWEILQYRLDKPKLKVSYHTGFISLQEGSNPIPTFFLNVSNIGRHKVILTSAGIHFKSDNSIIFFNSSDGFPKDLPPGDSHDVYRTTKEIRKAVNQEGKPLFIWAIDKTGRKYKGSTNKLLKHLKAYEKVDGVI